MKLWNNPTNWVQVSKIAWAQKSFHESEPSSFLAKACLSAFASPARLLFKQSIRAGTGPGFRASGFSGP